MRGFKPPPGRALTLRFPGGFLVLALQWEVVNRTQTVTGSSTDQSEKRREIDVKFEIENGKFVGTAEWQAPGQVALDMKDDTQRDWFERFFTQETSAMTGQMDSFEMTYERRDSSEEAFQRAAHELAARAYRVRAMGDGRRHDSR